MLIRQSPDLRESDVTPPGLYLRRREFLRMAGSTAVAAGAAGVAGVLPATAAPRAQSPSSLSTSEPPNAYRDATTYNNFYEFGLDKSDPSRHAHSLRTRPWSVVVDGECAKPGRYDIEDIFRWFPLEERIYRLRCVEAWSMVIPWMGFPLAGFIDRFGPTSKARHVEFRTLLDPRQMPGQTWPALEWPYTEGLRMDEALHPLAMLAVGMYGEVLPNQNGAPIRLVVPWKYGFKSIKSIVRVRFVEEQPRTSWQSKQPSEYGFFANVNPEVDHPRWSQKTERRIGRWFRQRTVMFNGYGEQVASLYAGMDLRVHY